MLGFFGLTKEHRILLIFRGSVLFMYFLSYTYLIHVLKNHQMLTFNCTSKKIFGKNISAGCFAPEHELLETLKRSQNKILDQP